ncbi:hypothetical protein ACFL6I_02295 [candidate division KSB1 bacterium]
MRKSVIIAVIVLTSIFQAGHVSAQDVRSPAPGERVKIELSEEYLSGDPAGRIRSKIVQGELTALSPESLTLIPSDVTASRSFPLDYIKRVQRFAGKKRRTREGVAAGFLTGLGVAIVLTLTWDEEGEEFGGKGSGLLISTIICGSYGAGLGAAVGSLIQTDRWEDIPLESIRSNRLPHNVYGVKIRFSLPFGKAAR